MNVLLGVEVPAVFDNHSTRKPGPYIELFSWEKPDRILIMPKHVGCSTYRTYCWLGPVGAEGVGILTITLHKSLVHTFTVLLGTRVLTQDVSLVHTSDALSDEPEGAWEFPR